MALAEITQVKGTAVPVFGDDIDTDRIIPARYMKCVTFDGLGEFMFYDVRFNEDGTQRESPFNEERYDDATILIAGSNFGCGSSREHAPQAIYRYGFRAIIAESFAEIFFGNCTTLGLPCVTVDRDDREAIQQLVEANAQTEIAIDLETKTVTAGNQVFHFDIPESARQVLLNGHWDPIADLLENDQAIDEVASKLAYMAA